MEKIQASEGHSRSGEPRGRGKSGHGKNPSKRGALTDWRAQSEKYVRTQRELKKEMGTHELGSTERGTSQDRKESKQARGTHDLESAGGTSQDMEII
jgi:hypothetical protein